VGNCAHVAIFWTAIVQKADSSSLFDDLDAALQSGSSERRVAMLRQVTDLTKSQDPPAQQPSAAFIARHRSGSVPRAFPHTARVHSDAGAREAPDRFFQTVKANAPRLLRFWQVRKVSAGSS
jgi:hypothetical protein